MDGRLPQNLGDRYGFRAEEKGSTKVLRPLKIVVTSNYTIRELWPDKSVYEPIERRFKSIQHAVQQSLTSQVMQGIIEEYEEAYVWKDDLVRPKPAPKQENKSKWHTCCKEFAISCTCKDEVCLICNFSKCECTNDSQ